MANTYSLQVEEFMLEAIYDSLVEISVTEKVSEQVEIILNAIEKGYFVMTIPDKPNSSKQKYRKSQI